MEQTHPPVLNMLLGLLALLVLLCLPATAQIHTSDQASYELQCKNHLTKTVSDLPSTQSAVDARVLPLEGTRSLRILGGQDGGVIVYGSNENHIIIVGCKKTAAESESRARQLLNQLVLHVGNGEVRAEGPEPSASSQWVVNFIVFVPARLELKLQTQNGGIDLVQMEGKVEARSESGGIFFRGSGGDVDLKSQDGGIDIFLQGSRWKGKGLNAHSDNGGLTIRVPGDYQSGILAETASNQLECKARLCDQSQKTRDSRREKVLTGGSAPTVRVSTDNAPLEILAARSEH